MASFFPTNASGRRALYELLHLWSGVSGYSTFNVGFAPVDRTILDEPAFAAEPFQIQLYCELVRSALASGLLAGKPHVLEVGAGGGGGLRMLQRQLPGARAVGVDNTYAAVLLGRLKGLDMQRATADRLPFESGQFDCLMCVDSFSIFPREGFLREARRVLKPEGILLIGDYLRASADDIKGSLESQAHAARFTLHAFRDATPGVLSALDADHDRKARIVERLPSKVRALLSETMSLRGTERYQKWQTGETTYYMAVLRTMAEI